jgi:hypothetical protein
MKKLWFGIAGLGVIVFIAGLVLTIVLTNETGEERPDSECSTTMRAGQLATCVVSDDPKVLLGVAPLLLGAAMVGIGIWRGIVTASAESSTDDDVPGGLFASIKELQDKAMQLQESAMGSIASAGTAAPGAPPPPTPPAPPPTAPAPAPPDTDT